MAEQAKTSAADVTQSPEFKKAVAEAVAALMQTDSFQKAVAANSHAQQDSGGDMNALMLMKQLAAEITKSNDVGIGRRPEDPRDTAKRAAAHEDMLAAITLWVERNETHKVRNEGKQDPNRPRYQVTGKIYLSDSHIDPFFMDPNTRQPTPRKVRWMGPPNQMMAPLNESAKEIFGHFMRSIGGKIVEEKAVKPLWMTAGGLVMEAGSKSIPSRRSIERDPIDEGIDIEIPTGPGQYDPRRNTLQVLGTIAEPFTNMVGGSGARPA